MSIDLSQPLISGAGPARRTSPKWLNSPVRKFTGGIAEIAGRLPEFERRPFALVQPDGRKIRAHGRLDQIVRQPVAGDADFVPVGIVSHDYALIPHARGLERAVRALEGAHIPPAEVTAELRLTESGERMALSLFFPPLYDFDPGDGQVSRMRLELVNSVDGSTRFRALIGWFRLVCSNGLVVGVATTRYRRRHVSDMTLDKIEAVLRNGLREAGRDKRQFERWRAEPVPEERLRRWVEEPLRKAWGYKSAARVYAIAQTGRDGRVVPPFDGSSPVHARLVNPRMVPGCPARSSNAYDLAQVLAWIVRERNDVQDQLRRRQDIPEMMRKLSSL